MSQKTTATPATYYISVNPEYIVNNFKNKTQEALVNAGGTITIGVMSDDATATLIELGMGSSNSQIKPIEGGYAVTWNLSTNNLDSLETMNLQFKFKDTTTGNVSWNVFSLDYKPEHGAAISGKFLPVVYIKTQGGFFQNNINEAMYDDFVLGGPGLTSKSTFPGTTVFGPSGAALSAAIKDLQVFDTLQLQPVYLVEPQPVSSPNNFIFRGDRPLGMYKKDGVPVHFNPTWKANSSELENVANNQFIDFGKLYDCMNNRLGIQLPSAGSLPTTINLLDISITDINQRYANIPSTDLPYQELRSFSSTYAPQTSVDGYSTILNSANLNANLPQTATIGTKTSPEGVQVTFADSSRFAWVDLGTTNNPSFTPNQTASQYAEDLHTMYGLDAEKYYNFIQEVIDWKNSKVPAGTSNVVYMHCNAGTMRTGTFLTCLMLTQNPTIKLEVAANYGKSLFGNDAGTARVIADIDDYWYLVQNYCAYLDLKTGNTSRNANIPEPKTNVFNSKAIYENNPNPWEWQAANNA